MEFVFRAPCRPSWAAHSLATLTARDLGPRLRFVRLALRELFCRAPLYGGGLRVTDRRGLFVFIAAEAEREVRLLDFACLGWGVVAADLSRVETFSTTTSVRYCVTPSLSQLRVWLDR